MKLHTNETPQKNYSLSLLRFIAMAFIVLCHFLQYYGNELAWWFNVGVQIFFCISGFLYGNKKITSPIEFVGKNFKKILIPYYCFLIPSIILYFVFHKESIDISTAIYSLLTIRTIDGLGHLWFISYILFCYLITPYLQALADIMKKLKWLVFSFVCILIAMAGFLLSYAFNSFFDFSRIFCYLFGYFTAVFLHNYKNNIFKIFTCIIVVLTIIMNIVKIYFKYINPGTFIFFDWFLAYAHALLGISITLIFIVFFKKIKRVAFLDLTDKYSFFIYIVHQIFILSPFNLLSITDYKIFNWTITVLSIILCAILLKLISDVVEKLFSNILTFVKKKICIS
ncbi:MAG: acyltransferase [Clostridia bacterium]|nr:acyltransferase [Clostridia bacterium]